MLRSLAISVARSLPPGLKQKLHNVRSLDNLTRKMYGAAVGSAPIPIADGPMKGILFAGGEHLSHAHISGTYERDLVDAIAKYLKPGMVCYDIGASIGYLSMQMAAKAKHVYAFEPQPTAANEIRRHCQANGFTNVEVVNNPVTDRVTEVVFAMTDVAYGSGIDWKQKDDRWEKLTLESTTLDLFAESHAGPDLLKMDIEGEEGRAMAGGMKMLAKYRPVVFCELHGPEPAKATCQVLNEVGYKVFYLTGEEFFPEKESTIIPGMLQVVALPQ